MSQPAGSTTLYVVYGVGTILAGKYRIERMIGEGGMGMVVAAMHLHLGTQVALKFLHQDMAMNQQMRVRRSRAMGWLSASPNASSASFSNVRDASQSRTG